MRCATSWATWPRGSASATSSPGHQFTWPGKAAAKAKARRPIWKTMRPEPERSVDWDTTKNLYIEGDNLDALKLLKETYAGQVKLIYIDPPYNTGHDFVYDDEAHLHRPTLQHGTRLRLRR